MEVLSLSTDGGHVESTERVTEANDHRRRGVSIAVEEQGLDGDTTGIAHHDELVGVISGQEGRGNSDVGQERERHLFTVEEFDRPPLAGVEADGLDDDRAAFVDHCGVQEEAGHWRPLAADSRLADNTRPLAHDRGEKVKNARAVRFRQGRLLQDPAVCHCGTHYAPICP